MREAVRGFQYTLIRLIKLCVISEISMTISVIISYLGATITNFSQIWSIFRFFFKLKTASLQQPAGSTSPAGRFLKLQGRESGLGRKSGDDFG